MLVMGSPKKAVHDAHAFLTLDPRRRRPTAAAAAQHQLASDNKKHDHDSFHALNEIESLGEFRINSISTSYTQLNSLKN